MSAYIFDVDGTLIDSYGGILESVMYVVNKNKYEMTEREALAFILKYSVFDLFHKMEKELSVSYEELSREYSESRFTTQKRYSLMKNAMKMLEYLKKKGSALFVFTHKGPVIHTILRENGIDELFTEVIHAESLYFKRKPETDSVDYLVEKYNLKRVNTYYVGDRPIDIQCANNAAIKSILLNANNIDLNECNPTFRVKDLKEIIEIEEGNLQMK